MAPFDFLAVLPSGSMLTFLAELAVRTIVAYTGLFLFLKLSGRRGIRQLSLFDLVIVLTIGSAAGDFSFNDDIQLAHLTTVFLTLLLLYRLTVSAMTRSKRIEGWVDGHPITVIKNGLYELESLKRLNMSSAEFFMELRQQGVEHLGQIRLAILETDGDVSLFFYGRDAVRPGLSVLPPEHRTELRKPPVAGKYCCVRCGLPSDLEAEREVKCVRCNHHIWTAALMRPRVT